MNVINFKARFKFTELSKKAQHLAITNYMDGYNENRDIDDEISYDDSYSSCLDINDEMFYHSDGSDYPEEE